MATKRTREALEEPKGDPVNLFKDVSDSDADTDSEDSVYSGLEEEPDTDSDNDNEDADSDDSYNSSDGRDAEKDISSIPLEGGSTDSDRDEEASLEKAIDIKAHTKSRNSGTAQATMKTESSTPQRDEYESDSSDEEDIRNTVGNVPLEWYKDYDHLGYDVEGRKIIKPKKADELDEFLNKMDNPDYWRTVTNKMTGQSVVLSKEDLATIKRLQMGKHPKGVENQYEPWVDFETSEVMIHPMTNRPEDKRSFIPSKWERLKVGQMVHALKMGWMKPTPKPKMDGEEVEEEEKFYMLWKDEEENDITKKYRARIPAPKIPLPDHYESYNPPPEYLFTKEEEEKWRNQDPDERRMKFLPQKFDSLRKVPSYPRFINERFERCLDLYLCPRQRKIKMNINPEDLIPKLPKPKDLQPFPTTQAVVYKGHTDIVRCIAVDPSGQWLASGSDDKTIRFWEVSSGRCLHKLSTGDVVKSLVWNPNSAINLVAAAVSRYVYLINPGLVDKLVVTKTDSMLESIKPGDDAGPSKKAPVEWEEIGGRDYEAGYRFKLSHPKEVNQVTWHGKGDYFASVMPKGDSNAVMIHQLSRQRSQNPFSKSKGLVQCVLFHPIRPFLFVATQRYVRVYNLLKQELTKKLLTNCKWVSSMAVHSGGDNLIIGSYDCRLSWFDLDLSTKPYQTLRHHKKALRQVCYHKRYPLFASASDDGTVIVCHGMVYNDMLKNPLIVPVKVLKGHSVTKDLGVMDCVFHPTQPWVFSAGADFTVRLFS
ncbi:Ribosome biogenesis protein bop1 [Mizuhopecten yessoensis]|uniref:Ribosome biogenesis protein BOP1 homolog n=2 Tax=Mizuhopecten yessoensis TaxID=6573 RepID=A0A210QXN8_MIZYE|nr:Ribosome biogenesis protein bop1 [Mizuhopecten yessoensis]